MSSLPRITSRERRALLTTARQLRQARSDHESSMSTLCRIEDDATYGVCVACRRFIGVERLLALPASTRCVDGAR